MSNEVLLVLIAFGTSTLTAITGIGGGMIVGALLGTHIRYKIPQALFSKILKWALTLLALRMIYLTLA